MASFAAFFVFISLAGYAAAQTCGTSGRACIDRATCDVPTSMCNCNNPPYVWGDGFFQCYNKNQVAAEARSDVSLTTFNNETTQFPFPCRYLVTHVRQELKGRGRRVIGSCEFMVHAFNKRFRGKVVTHGFDIAARITYNDGTPTVERSVRKFGTAANGVTSFTTHAQHLYLPNGLWSTGVNPNYTDPANSKIKISCFEDPVNSQIVYDFAACGLEVTFVPYDTVLRRDQPEIPGISVGINCAHHPVWLSNDQVIGLAPVFQGGSYLADLVTGTLSKGESLVDRAFKNSGVTQNHPDVDARCTDGPTVLNSCSTQAQKDDAYDSCYWMLEEARFIRCVSQNGFSHLDLFLRCVESKCGVPNPADCTAVKNDIAGVCTIGGSAKLTAFLAGALC